jgi:hypothetical protein
MWRVAGRNERHERVDGSAERTVAARVLLSLVLDAAGIA